MTLSQNLCCCDGLVCSIPCMGKVAKISLYKPNLFFCKEVLSVYFEVRNVLLHIYYMTLSQNLCCCDGLVCFIPCMGKVATISLYKPNLFFCKEVLSAYFEVKNVLLHIYYMTLSQNLCCCDGLVCFIPCMRKLATISLYKPNLFFL